MRIRSAAPCVVLAAVVLVVGVEYSSPGAYPDPDPRNLDLLASAQPTTAQKVASDGAFADVETPALDFKADAAATTSADCDGCVGESVALQVVYASRANQARLDNSAVAWTQGCQGCSAAALSVQVVVLPGRSGAMPNNRAMAVTAACDGCRTASAAFQVVVVADGVSRLSSKELAALRSWLNEQAAALRASVALPTPEPSPGPDPSPTAAPTAKPTPGPDPSPTVAPTAKPTPATSSPTGSLGRPYVGRQAKRVSTEALAELEALVTAGLDAKAIAADVDLGR